MAVSSTIRNYYRLAKPGIIYSNLLTAIAGFLYASRFVFSWSVLGGLIGGTACVIAAGCVFNNYLDRRIDQHMARTRQRATVTGSISARSTLLYATCLAIAGFGFLCFTSPLVMLIGFVALISYVGVYTYSKRITAFSTLIGTVPGAASLLAGYAAATGHLDGIALLLFIIMATWQTAHFYSISLFRLTDYQAAGLPVWPIRHGIGPTQKYILLFIVLFLASNVAFSVVGHTGYTYVLIMGVLSLYWASIGLRQLARLPSDKWGKRLFKISLLVMTAFSCLLALSPILP